jgi:cytochrome P450 family 26 subfamily A
MCKYSPEVFKTSLFGEKIVVFCGASGNKFLFTGHNKYVTSWWPPSMAKVWFFPENQENTVEVCNKMRSVLPEFLKPDALQDYIPVMDSMAKEQLETDWSPHKQVQVFSLSKKYTFASACKVFMNLIDPEQLTRLSNPFTHIVAGLISIPIKIPGTAFSRGVEGGKIAREELLAIIRQRKRELLENKELKSIDLLTRLLLASYENGETNDEKQIANKIIGLLVASHDTMSTALTCILNYLAEYPRVYEDVLHGMSRISLKRS